MAHVTLTAQRIREVHFINHIDRSGQIQLSNGFNFHVDFAADNTRCVATLYQSSQMKDDPDKFFISAEIVGVFSLRDVQSAEDKRDAHILCYDQLFPYLQSAMTQLATAAGMPGFRLKRNDMDRDRITVAKRERKQRREAEMDAPPTLPIV